MPEEYLDLVAELKELELPIAENGWDTRPNAESYGVVALEFEAGALYGDNLKQCTAYEGSVDLFSRDKHGAGWIEEIAEILKKHCEGCWSLNSHQWEPQTGLFHWEYVFQVEE